MHCYPQYFYEQYFIFLKASIGQQALLTSWSVTKLSESTPVLHISSSKTGSSGLMIDGIVLYQASITEQEERGTYLPTTRTYQLISSDLDVETVKRFKAKMKAAALFDILV